MTAVYMLLDNVVFTRGAAAHPPDKPLIAFYDMHGQKGGDGILLCRHHTATHCKMRAKCPNSWNRPSRDRISQNIALTTKRAVTSLWKWRTTNVAKHNIITEFLIDITFTKVFTLRYKPEKLKKFQSEQDIIKL